MIPLHTQMIPRRDSDAQSDMNASVASTTAADTALIRKPPSMHSAAKERVYKWSRRIMITTESLWLKKIRRNKFKTFVCIFLPSTLIFLLAFSLAPARGYSSNNNLMYYMGGIMKPDIMFTAGIMPKRIHSSRDSSEVRYTPLLAALGYGASSIEVYLWLKDGVLYAGVKDPNSEDDCDQTLEDAYFSNLRWMLENANRQNSTGDRPRGVFQSAPYMPLQLVMNIKTPGPPTLQALDTALQPFLEAGWLTTVDTTDPGAPPKQSALTIIVTGNAPLPFSSNSPDSPDSPGSPNSPGSPGSPNYQNNPNYQNSRNSTRYIFYDAPLQELDENPIWTPAISPMASASFSALVGSRWVVPRLAAKKLLQYVKTAHDRNITARVTDPIDFPVWLRNMYWQMLLDCGVDWLDVEDLYSAGQF